jgi:ferric-dicitrate binding protein FerR (iron transport regulator)
VGKVAKQTAATKALTMLRSETDPSLKNRFMEWTDESRAHLRCHQRFRLQLARVEEIGKERKDSARRMGRVKIPFGQERALIRPAGAQTLTSLPVGATRGGTVFPPATFISASGARQAQPRSNATRPRKKLQDCYKTICSQRHR